MNSSIVSPADITKNMMDKRTLPFHLQCSAYLSRIVCNHMRQNIAFPIRSYHPGVSQSRKRQGHASSAIVAAPLPLINVHMFHLSLALACETTWSSTKPYIGKLACRVYRTKISCITTIFRLPSSTLSSKHATNINATARLI